MRHGSLVILALLISAHSWATTSTLYHQDYRSTPKMVSLHKAAHVPGAKDAIQAAEAYLAKHAKEYGILDSKRDLKRDRVQKSLTGTHVHFVQMLAGVPVMNGGVVVSVSQDLAVTRVFNNYYSGAQNVLPNDAPTIGNDRAFDAAWSNLRVHGKLNSQPLSKLNYQVDEQGKFRLVYVTDLHVDAPSGSWRHFIDAYTGKVVERKYTAIDRHKRVLPDPESYNGPLIDRRSAFDNFDSKETKGKGIEDSDGRADGSAQVFDPDPRTALNNSELNDDSSAEAFSEAYVSRDLLDLTLNDGVYTLSGPWVEIADFESPSTEPSTSTTGSWNNARGDNSFNDVMTYFHLDQNQRYIQALGFTGETGIQQVPIRVDSDGLSGSDNSHFIPSSNSIAFGHGCVDDNEDADVILHEYGHAIHYGINSNWGGGDTGAIGEGFGDYWAGSYSVSTTNGLEFQPNKVFTWDGEPCWPGRRLNVTQARYEHSRNYRAHASLPGGIVTDELWSTPIFQSLLELLEAGVPRREVDQIILEAHFGLGYGVKMRDLAESTLQAAERLFPEGPHSEVFKRHFLHHEIIDLPKAKITLRDVTLDNLGSNGAVDPGETIMVTLRVANTGTAAAENVTALLVAAESGVEIEAPQVSLPNIPSEGSGSEQEVRFQVTVSNSFVCGQRIHLNLDLSFEGGASSSAEVGVELETGVPQGVDLFYQAAAIEIPDNNSEGIVSELSTEPGMEELSVSENIEVRLDIEHSYIGDLLVTLVSPSGTEVKLHDRSGSSSENIEGIYPQSLTPAESFGGFVGELFNGTWMLKVSDNAGQDVGSLRSWGIREIVGHQCEAGRISTY